MEKAIPFFQKVIELDSEDIKGHKVESNYQVALYEARYKKNPEPIKAFIADDPGEKYLLNSYMTLAAVYQRNKDNENVISTYEEALKKLPNNAQVMNSFAGSIFSLNIESHYEKALELNEKSAAIDPELEFSRVYNLVSYYEAIKDSSKLMETFETAIQDSENSDIWKTLYARTIVSDKMEDKYELAIKYYDEALKNEPEVSVYWYHLSLLYERTGKLEKALAAVNKAVEITPNSKTYQNSLSSLQKKLGEKE